jgi:hypothetical protein
MQYDSYGTHRQTNARYGQQQNRPEVGTQMVEFQVPGGFKQECGQKDQQNQIGGYVDGGKEMHGTDDQSDDHQHQGVGDPNPLGSHGHTGGHQQQQNQDCNGKMGFIHGNCTG